MRADEVLTAVPDYGAYSRVITVSDDEKREANARELLAELRGMRQDFAAILETLKLIAGAQK